ncbi:MAG: 30S ribosome-binding factor RbfA [Calditrichia bacterium]
MKFESVRQRKLADQIKKTVSQIIDQKLKDPRKGFITVTHLRLSSDLRVANIYFTVLGDEEKRQQSLEALESGNGFIRSELAPNLKLRFVPELRFFYDDTLDYSQKIESLLKKVKPENDNSEEQEKEV